MRVKCGKTTRMLVLSRPTNSDTCDGIDCESFGVFSGNGVAYFTIVPNISVGGPQSGKNRARFIIFFDLEGVFVLRKGGCVVILVLKENTKSSSSTESWESCADKCCYSPLKSDHQEPLCVGDKYVEHVRKAALPPPLTKSGTTLLISRPLDLSPQFLWGPITSYWDSQIDISAVITCSSGNVYMTHFERRESGFKF